MLAKGRARTWIGLGQSGNEIISLFARQQSLPLRARRLGGGGRVRLFPAPLFGVLPYLDRPRSHSGYVRLDTIFHVHERDIYPSDQSGGPWPMTQLGK